MRTAPAAPAATRTNARPAGQLCKPMLRRLLACELNVMHASCYTLRTWCRDRQRRQVTLRHRRRRWLLCVLTIASLTSRPLCTVVSLHGIRHPTYRIPKLNALHGRLMRDRLPHRQGHRTSTPNPLVAAQAIQRRRERHRWHRLPLPPLGQAVADAIPQAQPNQAVQLPTLFRGHDLQRHGSQVRDHGVQQRRDGFCGSRVERGAREQPGGHASQPPGQQRAVGGRAAVGRLQRRGPLQRDSVAYERVALELVAIAVPYRSGCATTSDTATTEASATTSTPRLAATSASHSRSSSAAVFLRSRSKSFDW